MSRLAAEPENTMLMAGIVSLLSAIADLSLKPDLWKAQNIYFAVGSRVHDAMRSRAAGGDEAAQAWAACFSELGKYLNVRFD